MPPIFLPTLAIHGSVEALKSRDISRADRVTNICERIVFLVTGTMEEINVSKY
ncbi:MAG: hypothetical protein ACE5OR_03145 [bacterium]